MTIEQSEAGSHVCGRAVSRDFGLELFDVRLEFLPATGFRSARHEDAGAELLGDIVCADVAIGADGAIGC